MKDKSIERILCFLLLPLTNKCYGFLPSPVRLLNSGKPLQTSERWLSSKNILEQNEAIEKLEKFLKKQKAETKETEILLKSLYQNLSIEKNVTDYIENRDDNNDLKESIASSLITGIDYGFVSRSEGNQRGSLTGGIPVEGYDIIRPAFEDYGPPKNILSLGSQAFTRNLQAIRGEYTHEDEKQLTKQQSQLHNSLRRLKLNSTAIWEREAKTEVDAPLLIKIPYLIICYLLDFVFEGRYVPSRFYLLETVARMPYFSYISMLHLYETLGWWRRSADIKRVHFAEEWNEFHHLLIMESLGGDQEWWVRFTALHSAIVYYWVLITLWMISPTLGYKFSELLETHAVNTYSQFVDENEKLLKNLPPPVTAIQYYNYGASDPLFGEYQTSAAARGEEPRRPGESMTTLYDVFSAIRDDEGDHVSTMKACLDPNVAVQSPAIERQILVGAAVLAAVTYFASTNDFSGLEGLDINNFVNDGEASSIFGLDADLIGMAALGEQLINDEEDVNELLTSLFSDTAIFATFDGARQLLIKILESIIELIR